MTPTTHSGKPCIHNNADASMQPGPRLHIDLSFLDLSPEASEHPRSRHTEKPDHFDEPVDPRPPPRLLSIPSWASDDFIKSRKLPPPVRHGLFSEQPEPQEAAVTDQCEASPLSQSYLNRKLRHFVDRKINPAAQARWYGPDELGRRRYRQMCIEFSDWFNDSEVLPLITYEYIDAFVAIIMSSPENFKIARAYIPILTQSQDINDHPVHQIDRLQKGTRHMRHPTLTMQPFPCQPSKDDVAKMGYILNDEHDEIQRRRTRCEKAKFNKIEQLKPDLPQAISWLQFAAPRQHIVESVTTAPYGAIHEVPEPSYGAREPPQYRHEGIATDHEVGENK